MANQAALVGYAHARTTALVFDSGFGLTQIGPITSHNGNAGIICPILDSADCRKIAGGELDMYMTQLLCQRDSSYKAAADFEMIHDLKVKKCYVALDFEQEKAKAEASSTLETMYELPDGQVITFNNERFQCPEVLFQPSLCDIEGPGKVHSIYL